MAWHQMGELTKEEYQHIVDAAAAEARKPLEPGKSRKMGQGWLTARRYDDHRQPETKSSQGKNNALQMRELVSDLAHMKKLQAAMPNDAQAKQIEKLQQQIEVLRGHQP